MFRRSAETHWMPFTPTDNILTCKRVIILLLLVSMAMTALFIFINKILYLSTYISMLELENSVDTRLVYKWLPKKFVKFIWLSVFIRHSDWLEYQYLRPCANKQTLSQRKRRSEVQRGRKRKWQVRKTVCRVIALWRHAYTLRYFTYYKFLNSHKCNLFDMSMTIIEFHSWNRSAMNGSDHKHLWCTDNSQRKTPDDVLIRESNECDYFISFRCWQQRAAPIDSASWCKGAAATKAFHSMLASWFGREKSVVNMQTINGTQKNNKQTKEEEKNTATNNTRRSYRLRPRNKSVISQRKFSMDKEFGVSLRFA